MQEQDVVVRQTGASAEGNATHDLSLQRSKSEDSDADEKEDEDIDMISPAKPTPIRAETSHSPNDASSRHALNPTARPSVSGPSGLIDLSSIIIRPEADLPTRTTSTSADPTSSTYLEAYFSSFHHRWPILHRPTFEGDESTLVVSSVKMIGAWLVGSQESKSFAVTWHDALMEQLVPRLVSGTDLIDENS